MMNGIQLKFLMVVTFLFLPSISIAEINSNRERLVYIADRQGGGKIYIDTVRNMQVDMWSENGRGMYTATSRASGNVTAIIPNSNGSYSGATSTNTVTGKVITKAPKSSVANGVIKNALKGAKSVGGTVARRNIYGLALTLLLEQLNKDKTDTPLPDGQRYRFDEKTDNFVYDGYLTLACANYNGFGAMDALECAEKSRHEVIYERDMNDLTKSLKQDASAARSVCSSISKTSLNFGSDTKILRFYPVLHENNTYSCYMDLQNKDGEVRKEFYGPVTLAPYYAKDIPWNGEIGDISNQDIGRWMEASVDEDGNIPDSETIAIIDDGQVAQTPPYTNKDGKAVQTRWDFETKPSPENGGLGTTKVRETTIPRPDLTPDSPEAPRLKPPSGDPSGSTSKPPSSSSGSVPDNGSPTGTPNDKDGNGDKDKDKDSDKDKDRDGTKDDEEDKKQHEPPQGLCDQYPDILACEKMGKVEEGFFDDIKVPNITDETKFTPDDFLPSDGVCPAPKSFNLLGKPIQVSYEPLCEFMRQVRFIILIGFILLSAFIVFGSLRKD